MENFAHLLNSIATILAAIAWPIGLIAIAVMLQLELRAILQQLPPMIGRIKKASLPGVQLELERTADQSQNNKSGEITPEQLEAANRIVIRKDDVGQQSLLSDLDRLCLEYDAIRRRMASGPSRTQAMTRVLVKMRVLAPALLDHIDTYKGSPSSGSRLAAIAMMQMSPRSADICWLKERFWVEQPFLFYHAALALDSAANFFNAKESKIELLTVAEQIHEKLLSFDGTPDEETVTVLNSLIESLRDPPK